MNERIRELAEQAGFGLRRDGEIYTSRLEHLPITEDIEKFAKLIVVECAGLLEKEATSNHDEGTDSFNVLMCESAWMKQHFGVEE